MANGDSFEIRDFLAAAIPVIFCPTTEYWRAEEKIRAALLEVLTETGKTIKIPMMRWKVTRGLVKGDLKEGVDPVKDGESCDPIEALSRMRDSKEPVLLVLHNIRHVVDDPGFIQGVIDAADRGKRCGSHLFIIGPSMIIPPELRHVILTYPFPLPDQAQLFENFRVWAREHKGQIIHPDGSGWLRKGMGDERVKILRSCARAASGMDLLSAETAFAVSVAKTATLDPKIIYAMKRKEIEKSDVLEFLDTTESMEDLGGFGALKFWVEKRRDAFSEEARQYGLSYPKGILIAGPSGTGKSLASKAVSKFLGLRVIKLDLGRVFRSYIGESEGAMRYALEVAEAAAPIVLWIDEIEKGMAGVRSSGDSDSGISARVMATLLTWRAECKAAVMVVATANDVSKLPTEVTRKGRFDEVWSTALPTTEEKEEIFRIHLRKRRRDPALFNVSAFAERADLFVGAEIEAVVESALFDAFYDGGREVENEDILHTIDHIIPQAKRDAEEFQRILEWSEKRARPVAGVAPKDQAGLSKVRKIRAVESVQDEEEDM